MVLSHSRWLYVEFTLGQSQEWWLGCHQRAFEKLGGVPREVMVDNCKTAVLAHVPGTAPVFNAQYQDFAHHHGFQIKACGPAHLKVILETGELGTYDDVRRASALAIAAGGDFIKTSTGKVTPAATLPVTLVMLETIREHWNRTGKVVGMKPAGGIRTAKEAIQYLVVVHETLGPDWLTPDRFRFGASSLVNDLLMQLEKEVTGAYADPDDFTLD